MLLIVDLDGCVYRGHEPVPGVPRLLHERIERGDTVVYCTNNSRLHRSEYVSKLTAVGAPVSEDRILTSARATALALTEDTDDRPVTMVLGGEGLERELMEVGLPVRTASEEGLEGNPRILVVGIDFELSYKRVSWAAEAVRRGARFVATNRDPVFPAPNGRLLAGAGAMVSAVATTVGREPDLAVGKPEPILFETAARIAGVDVRDAIVIGDSLVSDIPAARRVGAKSVLMLTGVTSPDELDRLDDVERPTAVARDASGLASILDEWSA